MGQYLFSYGTLQKEKVELESFVRLLEGTPDVLEGYTLQNLEIKDEAVLAQSEQQYHPIAIPTGNPQDTVQGVSFKVSMEEILAADQYEVSDYQPVAAPLRSGITAWVYVAAEGTKTQAV